MVKTKKTSATMRSRSAQPGFAMLLVLILVSAGFILSLAYLSVASVQVQVSQNYQSLARARYIAESGLEHAVYILRFSPEDLEGSSASPIGPFYVDDSSDSYTISALEDSETPGRYTLTAKASVGLTRRTSSMTVCRTGGGKIVLDYGVLTGGALTRLPTSLTVNGNVHVNGQLSNSAFINGDASATDGLSDPLNRISGSTTSGDAKEVTAPDISIDDYLTYTISGEDYQAVTFTGNNFNSNNPLADGDAVTPGNIGGVVYLKPRRGDTVKLGTKLNFTGTLIIDGNVQLQGKNVTLTAVDGFPAIVATGSIKIANSGRNVAINGTVVAKLGVVASGPTHQSSTTINGALISDQTGYDNSLGGNHVLNYQEDLADIYDFSGESGGGTSEVTVLIWND